jgi:acetoin utilization protein AcuB
MLVQDIMQRELLTVAPETPLADVARLLRRRGIRHVPVLERGALVGIISDRDLKGALLDGGDIDAVLADRLARDVMTRDVITIAPMFPVEEAARIMVSEKISALPVTQSERVVGIVTETDVLLLLITAMGVTQPSSRLDVLYPDRPDAVSEIVHAVADAGAIASIVTLTSPTSGIHEAVVRLSTINPGPAIKKLEAGGFTVRDSRLG